MKDRKKVLVVIPKISTFIQKDTALLKSHFDVRILRYRGLKNLPIFLPKIIKGVYWSDLTFIQFADNHALFTVFFSKIFRRKSIVILVGYEVAKISGFQYGLGRSSLFPKVVKYILNNANRVLAVSPGLRNDALKNLKVRGENIVVVPNGFNHTRLIPKGIKEEIVLAAALCPTMEHVQLKGIDTVIRTAEALLDVKFIIIGIHQDLIQTLRRQVPANVELLQPVSQEELISHFQKAKVFCQLSFREGHPNSVCEAMLCGCIPVGTDVPGIRFAQGNIGFLVPPRNPAATASAIEKALKSDEGSAARERIIGTFPLERRKQAFIDLIDGLID